MDQETSGAVARLFREYRVARSRFVEGVQVSCTMIVHKIWMNNSRRFPDVINIFYVKLMQHCE